jgi:nitrous oxide reductase accessory protein NosL
MKRPLPFLTLSLAALMLTACVGIPYDSAKARRDLYQKGEFWQRADASSTIWMQGPKAQQVLNRDLARCVTELNELVQLGQIKSIWPAEARDVARAKNQAHANLMRWETPGRDGAMLAEDGQYLDFESCMKTKGWERVLHVPYTTADRAADNYMNTHVRLKKFADYTWAPPPTTQAKGPYQNLNN